MNFYRRLLGLLLGKRLPVTEGTLKVKGIERPISIRRDRHGIPYIEAENDEDAWYGLGFCQGQDRAFQIEMLQRITQGTLSALIGPAGLAIDRLSRRIGFWRCAESQLGVLGESHRRSLEAFARGVTDGATLGCPRLPHEFVLLGSRPTSYTPVSVLALLNYMAFSMSTWSAKLARLIILRQDGPEAVVALSDGCVEEKAVLPPFGTFAGPSLERLAEDLRLLTAAVSEGGASNNWVLAGWRTATGRPLLANDPHLMPTLPPHWYLAQVRTPEWTISGACLAGSPGFGAGHNGYVAWGVTAGLVDNIDLYLEEIGPDGQSVRLGDAFVPCDIRRELIHVKGRDPVEELVMITPRGPIVSPALEGEDAAISMQAVWMQPRPIEGLFHLHRARTVEEFRQAFARWPSVSLNMVCADISGTIGWQLIGEVPQRKKGAGTTVLPGWDPEVGWAAETVPFDEMPHAVDPDCGYLATANSKPRADGRGPYLGTDWYPGYRLARIIELLESRRDWDRESTQRMQLDRLSLPWRAMREIVLSVPPANEATREALKLLREWDSVLSDDSPAATLYVFFVLEMARRMAAAKAPHSVEWALGEGFHPLVLRSSIGMRRISSLIELLHEQPTGWFARPWPEELADALGTTFRTLEKRYGPVSTRWAWGRVRPLRLLHLAGGRWPLDRIFNLGPIPWGGDGYTLNMGAVDPLDPTANPGAIPSLRMVADVGMWGESRFSLPGGQSGNPCSVHYDDLLAFWLRGEGVPIAWSAEEIKAATVSTLRLEPRSAKE